MLLEKDRQQGHGELVLLPTHDSISHQQRSQHQSKRAAITPTDVAGVVPR